MHVTGERRDVLHSHREHRPTDARIGGGTLRLLTAIDVTVPVTGGIHHYGDLAEREVR